MAMICSQPIIGRQVNVSCCKKRSFSQVDSDDVNVAVSEDKLLRVAMLKTRFASLIAKSEKELGKKVDEAKADMSEKQSSQGKAKFKLEQRQRERAAARKAIESMTRTVQFGDGLKAENELLVLMADTKIDEWQIKKEIGTWVKQLREDKATLKLKQLREDHEATLKLEQRQREREAARKAIESIKRTVHFGDDLIAEKELLVLMGAV